MKRLLFALLFSVPLYATPQHAAQSQTIHVDQHVVLQETVTVHYDSVYLNWTASTSSGVTSYNVYRGSQTGGPYTLIGSASSTNPTYTDATVLINNSYFYVVTAVAPACPNNGNPCGESSYSNEAKAVMP